MVNFKQDDFKKNAGKSANQGKADQGKSAGQSNYGEHKGSNNNKWQQGSSKDNAKHGQQGHPKKSFELEEEETEY